MGGAGDGAHTAPAPPPAALPLAMPMTAPRKRSLTRLWVEVRKAAIPAIVTGILGYAGGLVIPPTAVYDRFFRQDPNELEGVWVGSVAGSNATLKLVELDDPYLKASLQIGGRIFELKGSHDSLVNLEGRVDDVKELKIGLNRKMGERYGPDNDYLLLVPDEKQPPVLLCDKDTMNITGVTNCQPPGQGITFFARRRTYLW